MTVVLICTGFMTSLVGSPEGPVRATRCILGSAVDHSTSNSYVDSLHQRLLTGVDQETGDVMPDLNMDCTARACGDARVEVRCMGVYTRQALKSAALTRGTDYSMYLL